MAPSVFLAPAGPPPVASAQVAAPSPWYGLGHRWLGWDDSVWDLSDWRSGAFLTGGGVRGLTMPEFARHTSRSASIPGARYRGHVEGEREAFWPLYLYADDGSQAWVERDRAFWRTLQPGRTGQWEVRHPDGGSRRLRLRLVDDGQHAWVRDPVKFGWALYGITLVAEQPFWEGDPVVRSWAGAGEPGNFPWTIARGNTLASASMPNPGDVDAWPVWTVHGPVTSVTVGVGGRLITAPIELAEGEWLRIDPRPGPRGKSAYDSSGARRTPELTVREFEPVPPGESVPLSLAMTGTGRVEASLTPLWYRAW